MRDNEYADRLKTLYGHERMYYASEFAGPELIIENDQMAGGVVTGFMRLDWDWSE